MKNATRWILLPSVVVSTSLLIISFFTDSDFTTIAMIILSTALIIYLLNIVTNYHKDDKNMSDKKKKLNRLYNGEVYLDGSSIIVTPILLDNGEISCELTQRGQWVWQQEVLFSEEDYLRMYPRGRPWRITAPDMVEEITEALKGARLGDDIQVSLASVVHARKEGTQEEYEEMLLALDVTLDEYLKRDVFLKEEDR